MNHLATPSFVLALLLTASTVGAEPVLRYTWGDASGLVVNQSWSGPHTYTQTLSATGLTGQVSRVELRLWTNVVTPPAWWMTVNGVAPASDCAGHPAFLASPDAAGAQTIPGATVSAEGWYRYVTSIRPWMYVTVAIDPPLAADPGVRYGLATLTYDHTNSALGPTGPCADADKPYCFVVIYADVLVDGTWQTPTLEAGTLSWQNESGETDCWMVVPARPTTWGRLKAIYR